MEETNSESYTKKREKLERKDMYTWAITIVGEMRKLKEEKLHLRDVLWSAVKNH